MKAQTICIKSLVSCEPVTSPLYNTAVSTVSGSSANCTFSASFTVTDNSIVSFGTAPATCSSSSFKAPPNAEENSAVAFWVIDGPQNGVAVATVCKPTLTVQRADVFLNSTTSSLLLVNNQQPLLSTDQMGVDLNSAPFNGSAYNAYVLFAFMSVICYLETDAHKLSSVSLFFDRIDSPEDKMRINSTRANLGQAIATLYSTTSSGASRVDALRFAANDAYAHCEYSCSYDLQQPRLTVSERSGTCRSFALLPPSPAC